MTESRVFAQLPGVTLFAQGPFLLLLLAGVAQSDTIPSRPCNQILATYKNVPAYSNGVDQWSGYSCAGLGSFGYQYQCVEYVNRFYAEALGIPQAINWFGNAQDYFASAGADVLNKQGKVIANNKMLAAFPNGGLSPPQPDDILVFASDDKLGHVAIVTNVTASEVDFIEQNFNIAGVAGLSRVATVSGYDISNRISIPINDPTHPQIYTVLGWLRVPPTTTQAPSIRQFPLPTANSNPLSITAGPDGALWFTEASLGVVAKIGRITTTGVLSEYPLPDLLSYPTYITAGPDGALWFIEEYVNKIGRITTGGMITEYAIPGNDLGGITAGPDGNLWFTYFVTANPNTGGPPIGKVGKLTPSGTLSDFTIPPIDDYTSSAPYSITEGPDGALWFTEVKAGATAASGYIGRITTDGSITEYLAYASPGGLNFPFSIITGPDGALWFLQSGTSIVGRITTTGSVTEYSLPPVPGSLPNSPTGIASGPDGGVWFVSNCSIFDVGSCSDSIGRVSPGGVVAVYPLPSLNGHFTGGITAGPDGNMWFAARYTNSVEQAILNAR